MDYSLILWGAFGGLLPDVSIRQLMIWQDFNYSSIQCQVETPDII